MQYTLYVILAPLAAAVSISVAIYGWRHRVSPAAPVLIWFALAATGWLIGNILELTAGDPSVTAFWAKLSYVFIASLPVMWLVFALQYTGRQNWLTRPRLILLFVVPVITNVLVQTNELHHLIWQQIDYVPVEGFLSMRVTYGTWFWFHVAYAYTLLLAGAFLIGQAYFQSLKLYRQQSIWLLIAAFLPITANIVYIFHLIPDLKKDYSPLSFALAGLAVAIAMFRYRLLDLRPIARNVLVDRMSDGVLVLDDRNRIVDLNPAACEIISIPDADAVVGRPAIEVLQPFRQLVDRFRNVMDVRADVTFVHAGRLYWYELHIVPLTDPDSGPTARLVHLRDITPRKQAEEALRQANLELQARNAELDAFGHTVAHDLKNSLSAIIGYASMLDESYDRLPLNELHLCFQSIGEISHKMNNILEELMLLSGLRQIQVVMEPIDMGRIVGEAQQRLSTLIEKHQAEILCPATWPVATGYAPWVEEAWTNYLSNAIKYGGRPPRVQLGAEVQPDHTVRFWVQDNGHGLSPQAQARLFQPFERLDQARATGHGLGLSIVRRVVEKMGGHVGVESVGLPGQGCIFSFTLPAVEMPPQT